MLADSLQTSDNEVSLFSLSFLVRITIIFPRRSCRRKSRVINIIIQSAEEILENAEWCVRLRSNTVERDSVPVQGSQITIKHTLLRLSYHTFMRAEGREGVSCHIRKRKLFFLDSNDRDV